MIIRYRTIFAVTAFCIAAFLGSVQASAGQPIPPAVVTVTEGITVNTAAILEEQAQLNGAPNPGFRIDYTVSHNGPGDALPIIGFAIDFGIPNVGAPLNPPTAGATPGDWSGEVITEAAWDGTGGAGPCVGGVEITVISELTTCDLVFDDLDSFDDFFGPDAELVALFTLNDLIPENGGGNIGPIEVGETEGGFFVEGDVALASNFVAICSDGQVAQACAIGAATTASVPEPGTLALIGIGLAGLGIARRRRNR